MNKINPLYILALFTTLLLISFSQLNTKKEELVKSTNEFNLFKENVLKYKSLKKLWENKEIDKQISLIVKLDKNIEIKEYKRKLILTLNSSNNSLKQRFINKTLNSNLKIEKFNISEDIVLFEIGKN